MTTRGGRGVSPADNDKHANEENGLGCALEGVGAATCAIEHTPVEVEVVQCGLWERVFP